MLNPQLDRQGRLTHLLTAEGLPRRYVELLLERALGYLDGVDEPAFAGRRVSLLCGAQAGAPPLCFAQAAQRLCAGEPDLHHEQVGGGWPAAALAADICVLRHRASGAAHWLAARAAPGRHIINAGDGCYAQPVQALADLCAIRRSKPDLAALTVAIVGDIRHSGRSRCLIHACSTLGVAELRVVAPLTLLPAGLPQLGVRACHSLAEGLSGADVVVAIGFDPLCLPQALLPSAQEYQAGYGVTAARLAQAGTDALLLERDAQWPAHSALVGPDQLALEFAVAMAAMTLLLPP